MVRRGRPRAWAASAAGEKNFPDCEGSGAPGSSEKGTLLAEATPGRGGGGRPARRPGPHEVGHEALGLAPAFGGAGRADHARGHAGRFVSAPWGCEGAVETNVPEVLVTLV